MHHQLTFERLSKHLVEFLKLLDIGAFAFPSWQVTVNFVLATNHVAFVTINGHIKFNFFTGTGWHGQS